MRPTENKLIFEKNAISFKCCQKTFKAVVPRTNRLRDLGGFIKFNHSEVIEILAKSFDEMGSIKFAISTEVEFVEIEEEHIVNWSHYISDRSPRTVLNTGNIDRKMAKSVGFVAGGI